VNVAENKTMKLSKEQLKQIIKEELNHLMLEQQAEESAEEAKEMLASPKADTVFDALSAKPEVRAALQAVLNQAQQMNEEYDDGGGLYGPEDGNVAAKVAGAGVAGATMMASPILASVVINSPVGQQLMDALAPYVDPALTALGIGGATMAGSVVAALAIALAANQVGKKS
jgi:hypothetical protein